MIRSSGGFGLGDRKANAKAETVSLKGRIAARSRGRWEADRSLKRRFIGKAAKWEATASRAFADEIGERSTNLSVNPLRFVPRFRLPISRPNAPSSGEDEARFGRPLRMVNRGCFQP
jgi:hypothetical protein